MEQRKNQLLRCPCGNILAGYDGRSLTSGRRDDPSPWHPARQISKSLAKTVGAESTFCLMDRPSIHGQWQETALEIKTIDRADEFRRPFGNMDFRQQNDMALRPE